MPSIDPETGKEVSGGQKRRRKIEYEAGQSAIEILNDADDCSWANEFREAGQPDLENPGTDLDYVRKLQLISLRQMATTAKPSKLQQDCWRRIREMSAVVGMTSNRAQLEAKVRKLEKLLSERQAAGSAVVEVAGSRIKRPPTARGAAPPGPRSIPPDAVADDSPEEK